jgi:hypothetical protein
MESIEQEKFNKYVLFNLIVLDIVIVAELITAYVLFR